MYAIRSYYDDVGHDVGQDVVNDDATIGGTGGNGRFYVIHLPQHQCLAAHLTGQLGPFQAGQQQHEQGEGGGDRGGLRQDSYNFV